MKFLIVLWICKLARFAISLIDKSRGTDFPGKLALRLDKNFNTGFGRVDFEKVIIITGSNGKSTVTNLLYTILVKNGYKTGANLKGSNMLNGATTVFINNMALSGRLKADFVLIEADERSLPVIYQAFPAKNVMVTNIMQDQVHRNGEPDYIYQILKKTINRNMTLFLNNHEPRSKSYEDLAGRRVFFCADRLPSAYDKNGFYDVTLACPKCASKIEFTYMNTANTGEFICSVCGFASEKPGDDCVTAAANVNLQDKTFEIRGVRHDMPYAAPVMLYNYAAASSVCRSFGLTDEQTANGMKDFVNVAGRIETIAYKDKKIHYLRMKQENPETLQDALNAVALDKRRKVFLIGLCTVDERRPKFTPHYANTYYAYESDFKPLLASGIEKIICFSEYVCYDIANRLYYDGAAEEDVVILNTDAAQEIFPVVDACGAKDIYIITLMKQMDSFKKYIRQHGGQ